MGDAVDSFIEYDRAKCNKCCRTDGAVGIAVFDRNFVDRIRTWGREFHPTTPLPVHLRAGSSKYPLAVQNILAALDGCVRSAEGGIIATVVLVLGGVRLASRTEILNWVASAVRTNLWCIATDDYMHERVGAPWGAHNVVVPDLASSDALEAALRAAPMP